MCNEYHFGLSFCKSEFDTFLFGKITKNNNAFSG